MRFEEFRLKNYVNLLSIAETKLGRQEGIFYLPF